MLGAEPALSTAEIYRRFAREVAGKSPLYADLCERVAEDADLRAFLERVPPVKRQPNLLLGAVRYLSGTPADLAAFRAAILGDAGAVAALLMSRRTQTNEPGRCAALLPLLAALPQPLALLEVGASAGLCLLPDRYAYDYGGARIGDADVVFPCVPEGPVPLPARLPAVTWRAGLDLDPVDVHDDDAVRWLEALVWPEETDRLARLRAAIAIARRDPPRVIRGDLLEDTAALAAEAPPEATLVVFHTAVLAYLQPTDRDRFTRQVQASRAVWIACEAPRVLTGSDEPHAGFLLTRNGNPVASCDSHGRWLRWRTG
jgi:hypothetical protein